MKLYKHIQENGGWDDVMIVLVQECDNYKQAEDGMIRNSLSDPLCLNSYRAVLTQEEVKEAMSAYQKAHYETNREVRLTKQKAYDETHREAILAYQKAYYYLKKKQRVITL